MINHKKKKSRAHFYTFSKGKIKTPSMDQVILHKYTTEGKKSDFSVSPEYDLLWNGDKFGSGRKLTY